MTKQMIGVNFDLKFENVMDINPSFAKARIGIAYAGRNRNKSCISKEVFEEAVPSLFYCPVVGRYDPDKNDFGSHDIRVVRNAEGNLSVENATTPYGVVFADDGVAWETVTEADGTERDYLFCNVILWKRQYGYECLASQDTWHQSMEIHVDRYMIDHDGYCNIEKMYFEALCILGNEVEPCFESASVQLAANNEASNYRLQFAAMMDELRQIPEFRDMKFDFSGTTPQEGGKTELNFSEEIRDQILAEFGLILDDLNFEITEDMTEETFRAAIAEMQAAVGDPAAGTDVTFSATYRQKYEAIQNALDPIIVYDGDGALISETRYWVSDFDDTHVFVERGVWTADDYNRDYGRFQYSMSEDGLTASIAGDFEEMVMRWLTLEENAKLEQSRNAFEALTGEFEEYKASHSTENTVVDELQQFKNERLAGDHRASIDAVLSEFEDLSENEEFSALTANENEVAYGFADPDALRKECFAIRGKAVAPTKFAKQKPGVVKVGLKDEESKPSRYGNLFDLYG